VENDNVHLGRLLGDEVSVTALDPPGDARLLRELPRSLVVSGRELDDGGLRGAALEQLDRNRADATPGLENGLVRDPVRDNRVDDPLRRPVEAAAPIARSVASSLSRGEELVVSRGGAAAGDGMTVSPTRTLMA
jgi:hypothetical protein